MRSAPHGRPREPDEVGHAVDDPGIAERAAVDRDQPELFTAPADDLLGAGGVAAQEPPASPAATSELVAICYVVRSARRECADTARAARRVG